MQPSSSSDDLMVPIAIQGRIISVDDAALLGLALYYRSYNCGKRFFLGCKDTCVKNFLCATWRFNG
jgi:hypothetical protein